MTWRQMPFATRLQVFTTGSLSMMLDPRSVKSSTSATTFHGFCLPVGVLWQVGAGQTMGRPSVRPIMYRRLRVVPAPALAAMRTWCSTWQPMPRTRADLGTH